MIIDTSFLVDILRDRIGIETVEELDYSADFRTTAITVMELSEGIKRAEQSKKEEEKIRELLENINTVGFDGEDGRKASEVSHRLREKGEVIDVEDVMIASIAINEGDELLTSNVDHFERIEDLEVMEPGELSG